MPTNVPVTAAAAVITTGTVVVNEDDGGLLIPGRRMIRTRVIILHAETKCANHCKKGGSFEDNERERESGRLLEISGGLLWLGSRKAVLEIDGDQPP